MNKKLLALIVAIIMLFSLAMSSSYSLMDLFNNSKTNDIAALEDLISDEDNSSQSQEEEPPRPPRTEQESFFGCTESFCN